jgi:hypothetical protein
MYLLQELNRMVLTGSAIWTEGKTIDIEILHGYNKTVIANVAHGNH